MDTTVSEPMYMIVCHIKPTHQHQNKKCFIRVSSFFTALQDLPSFEPRFGKQRPRAGGFIQKGVDILLAIDLVRLSSKGQIQKAFLIAGDGDFVPVVKTAKDEGVSVKLYHSGAFQTYPDGRTQPKYSNELWSICDEREIITADLIKKCAF